MDLGFETIGNATLICYDGGPLLATDPWLVGPAYFGSWVHQHRVPDEQVEAVRACRYLWISHGHPDHLSHASLELLRDTPILLPDHEGGRIRRELEADGFRTRVLPDGEWIELGPRTRVCCVADVNQDAVLLVDLDGRLIADVNDASDHGGGPFLAETARRFDDSYLLCLTGYGDADMINVFDEEGRRVPPPALRREPIGPGIAGLLARFGLRHYVPFSTMHRYQRADSVWANACITRAEDMARGFSSDTGDVLPPYVHVDLARDEVRGLDPPATPELVLPPETFGDDWSDELEPAEVEELRAYLEPVTHLRRFLGFVRFVVGGKEHVIDLAPEHRARGITFETPRASLLTAVRYRVFDDLLIGNFTRTTLHGDWSGRGTEALYPDFTPFLAKYADNGGARSEAELRRYFDAYRRRGFTDLAAEPAAAKYLDGAA